MTNSATRTEARTVGGICIAMALVWVVYGQLSPGTFNDDDITHFFMARESLRDPSLWISLWGRPLFTFVYAVPAAIGYWAVELLTALISSATLWMTWKLASAIGLRSRIGAVMCTLWQPFFFKLGYACLVEPMGACLLTTALWAFVVKRNRLAAILVGLLPLTRLELITITPLLLIPLVGRRRGWTLLLAPLPLLTWNLAGWYFAGDPVWLFSTLQGGEFTRSLPGQPLVHYFRAVPMFVGGALTPFFLAGLLGSVPTAQRAGILLLRSLFAVFLPTLALLAWNVHGFGGSVGFLRHLVAVGPVIGILAAAGIDAWREPALTRPRALRRLALSAAGVALSVIIPLFALHMEYWEQPTNRTLVPWLWPGAGLAAVAFLFLRRKLPAYWATGVLLVAAIATLISETPIQLTPEQQAMGNAAEWYKKTAPGRVMAVNHPWFFFLGDLDRRDTRRFPPVTRESLSRLPVGGLILWESHYSHRLSGDVDPEYIKARPDRYKSRGRTNVSQYFFYVIFEVVRK